MITQQYINKYMKVLLAVAIIISLISLAITTIRFAAVGNIELKNVLINLFVLLLFSVSFYKRFIDDKIYTTFLSRVLISLLIYSCVVIYAIYANDTLLLVIFVTMFSIAAVAKVIKVLITK